METGSDTSHVLKFGNRWPGVYLCGQDALMYARHVRTFIDNGDLLSKEMAKELAELLESCHV